MLENKTVLLIAPVFYGYEKVIIQQLKNEGATVIFYPERKNSLGYKIAANSGLSILADYQKKYYSGIYKKTKNLKADYLFVIRGFLMPLDFIHKMRKQFSAATFIMHQWDSIKNYDYAKYLLLFDKISSFDPADCAKYPALKYLPNFYLPEYANMKNNNVIYDVSFIGWAYKSRLTLIEKLKNQLNNKKFFTYLYMPFSTYLKEFLKRRKLNNIKHNTLSIIEVQNIVEQSFCILDITDEKQTGYTYRTIDAMAAEKKLISTNRFLQQEAFFNEQNIQIIDRDNPKVNPKFFETSFIKIDLESYSLENWVRKIFASA